MSTETHPAHAEEFEVVIVPGDMEAGTDADGNPITVPGRDGPPEAPKPKADPAAEKAKRDQDQLVKALKEERDQRIAEASRERQARAAAEQHAAAERQARAAAEQEAGKFTDIAARAHMSALYAKMNEYEGSARNAKATIASIRREKMAALENADHARVVELDEQLAKATNVEMTFTNEAALYQDRIKDAEARFRAAPPVREPERTDRRPPADDTLDNPPTQQTKKPATPDEWIDAVAPTIGDEGANWLREHKEFVTDGAKHQQLRKFTEYYAAKHGGAATLKTSAFTEALDREFFAGGEVTEEAADKEPAAPAAKPAQRAAPAAPVSRGAPAKASNESANRIELSPQEHSLAPQMWAQKDWELFDPTVKSKFKEWSPTAARWQYHYAKRKGEAEGKLRG